jgi:3-hydroxyisobutyrate dehydrogenase-like beta-hydroxyacid dehydrogenase
MLKVGFIGLGLMGNPMAKNVCRKGFPLFVFNRTASKTKEFIKLGCTFTSSPAELSNQVDVIITMVTGPKDLEEVIFGKNGIVKGGQKGKPLVVIDMSTVGVKTVKAVAKKLSAKGIEFIDAPVTGGVPGAEKATLAIFAGGKKSVFEKVKPILLSMGTNVHYMGENGQGQAIKLVNNLLVAETITALSEAMLLADSLKLPRRKIVEILSDVPAVSTFMKMRMSNLEKDNHPVSFSVANLNKDLGLALDEIKGKKLPILSSVHKLYTQGTKQGQSDQDISAVIRILQEKLH